jgi:FMN reductase
MIDHQLRPLFSFFQARTLPLGVYATDTDFADGSLRNDALLERAQLAVEKGLPMIELACRATTCADLEAVAA